MHHDKFVQFQHRWQHNPKIMNAILINELPTKRLESPDYKSIKQFQITGLQENWRHFFRQHGL